MENAATEKHEFYKGEIFAMSGSKSKHFIVTANLFVALSLKLKGKSCQPYNSDTRIHIPENSLFTYPDISIICGPLESLNNDDLNFLNPTAIIEVLSPTTQSYEGNEKFELYKAIPTFKEYVLVDPDKIHIDVFYLNPKGIWEHQNLSSLSMQLTLQTVQVSISIEDIYERTKVLG